MPWLLAFLLNVLIFGGYDMLKKWIRKKLLGYKASSEEYLNFLKRKGAKIGGGYTYIPQITHILTYSFHGCSKLVMKSGLLLV